MSFNSPAKQERIERHLMRQRGAGVKTVSSNFGFAFGSISAPSSQDASTVRDFEEPPAKRRKTILSNEVVVAEYTAKTIVDVQKSSRIARKRRKIDLENEDLDQANAEAEDSFIAVLGKRRTTGAESKAKKTPVTKKPATARGKTKEEPPTDNEQAAEVPQIQPATVSGPRRRAAATPTSGVAAGLEEETMPLDKKRQVSDESKKRGRSRKKDVVIEQEAGCGDAEHVLPDDDASEAPVKVAPQKRAAGRKRKVKKEDTVLEHLPDAAAKEQTPMDAFEAQNKVAPKRPKTARKCKVRDEDSALEKTVSLAVEQGRDEMLEDVALREADEIETHRDVRSQKSASRNVPKVNKTKQPPPKRTRQKVTEVLPCIELSADSPADVVGDGDFNDTKRKVSSRTTKATRTQRQPLAETNMNVTMQSASPGKLPQNLPEESTFQEPKSKPKKPTRMSALHQPLAPPTKPEPKRRKLNIKRDANETASQCSGSATHKMSQLGDISETKDSEVAKQTSLDRSPTTVASAADHRRGAVTAAKCRGNLTHASMEDAGAGIASSCQTSTANALVANDPNAKTISKRKGLDGCGPADAKDEDIDWIFAPQPQANCPKSTTSKLKRGSAVKKRKFKMPDMDLDELLSNIGTFAQEKTMLGPVVAKDVKLFAGNEKRPRGAVRKKAKG